MKVLCSVQQQKLAPQQKLNKVLIVIWRKWKTFTIRNVDPSSIQSITDLKTLIRDQLKDDFRKNFDVGYIQRTNDVRVEDNDRNVVRIEEAVN